MTSGDADPGSPGRLLPDHPGPGVRSAGWRATPRSRTSAEAADGLGGRAKGPTRAVCVVEDQALEQVNRPTLLRY